MLLSEICFVLVKSFFNIAAKFAAHSEKSFVPAFFKVSFDNLESGKKKTAVLEKSLEKVLIFGSKSSMNPDFKIM